MPTEKARYTITVDDELLDEIEKYRYEHRLSSKNSATIELLRKGMEELNRIRQERAERNKAPTAEDAAEALYEVLYYHLGHPPSVEEIERLNNVLPIICKGIAE